MSNVDILDAALSDQDKWDFLYSVDALISLHRSEGFGLTIAEAMSLGKPVVVTGWSGNMDFVCEDSAYLVDYKLAQCIDTYGVYKQTDSEWAEADIRSATRQIEALVADSQARQVKAGFAKAKIQSFASAQQIGEAMAERLKQAD